MQGKEAIFIYFESFATFQHFTYFKTLFNKKSKKKKAGSSVTWLVQQLPKKIL